eukprot:UN28683
MSNKWGVQCELRSRPWKVISLTNGCQFQKKGVQPGWIIVEVDGDEVGDRNADQLKKYLTEGLATSITFNRSMENRIIDNQSNEVTISFDDNASSPWGAGCELRALPWKVTKVTPGKTFAKEGVQVGWTIKSIDDREITQQNESKYKQFLTDGLR